MSKEEKQAQETGSDRKRGVAGPFPHIRRRRGPCRSEALTRDVLESWVRSDMVRFWLRFWARVEQMPSGCWEWRGAKTHRGYGRIVVLRPDGRHRPLAAHRIAYVYDGGELDEGIDLLHSCDNPACVRPEHLHPGDQAANMREMHVRGRAARGEKHGRAKLTVEQVRIIKRWAGDGVTTKSLARLFRVSEATARGVLSGRVWKHVSVEAA